MAKIANKKVKIPVVITATQRVKYEKTVMMAMKDYLEIKNEQDDSKASDLVELYLHTDDICDSDDFEDVEVELQDE